MDKQEFLASARKQLEAAGYERLIANRYHKLLREQFVQGGTLYATTTIFESEIGIQASAKKRPGWIRPAFTRLTGGEYGYVVTFVTTIAKEEAE